MARLRDLTPEETTRPYAKYFYYEPATIAPELAPYYAEPLRIDPSRILPIEDRNDLLQPGYLDDELGYCLLPNGGAYVAVHNKMPGVSADMVNWWFAWHSLEDMRYMLWWPKDHYAISVSDGDRAKILDSERPMTQRFQGTTHHVVEDIGQGVDELWISFMTPEDFGFDMSRFHAPNVATLVAANVLVKPGEAPADAPGLPVAMCHFIRDIEGGVEFRTRFWMGYQMVDAEPVFMLPEGIRVPESVPRGLFLHNLEEYANLRAILPQLYTEQEGKVA
jgi:hypothetical protein